MTSVTLLAVAALTNLVGRLPGNAVLVTNTVEYVSSATNEAHKAIRVVDTATKGVQDASWYVKDDWVIRWQRDPEPTESELVTVTTNDAGQVFKAETATFTWPAYADLSAVRADIYSMKPLGEVGYSVESGASISGNRVSSSSPGAYLVTATASDGSVRSAKVPLWSRRSEGNMVMTYEEDVPYGDSIVKAVNDEFLEDLKAMTSDHVEYGYVDGAPGTFKKWTFGNGLRNPCRPRTARWWSYTPMSPHVLVHATHCPWIHYGTSPVLTFDGNSGPVSVTVDGATVVDLAEWAQSHSMPDDVVSSCGDVSVAVVAAGSATVPPECCPYFIDPVNRDRLLGTGTAANTGSLMAWVSSQNYDNNVQFVPAVAFQLIGGTTMFNHPYLSRCVVSDGGFDAPSDLFTKHKFSSEVFYEDFRNIGGAPGLRKDIREYFESKGTLSGYWKFPYLYVGDSGGAGFVKYDGKFIYAGHTKFSTAAGSDFLGTPAVTALKAFCAQFGDTLKEVE